MNFKAEQSLAEKDRTIKELQNHNLQLELDLTRTKLELLELQQDSSQSSAPKLETTVTTTSDDNPIAKPTLESLQQDPTVQSELKSLMDCLGDPVLLVLTKEEQDPACLILFCKKHVLFCMAFITLVKKT